MTEHKAFAMPTSKTGNDPISFYGWCPNAAWQCDFAWKRALACWQLLRGWSV